MIKVPPFSTALSDPNLLGAALGSTESWKTWLAVLKGAFAEAMTDDERTTFASVAGDRVPPTRRVRELWAGPIGRRSGKSRMAAAVATWIAALVDHSATLSPGEVGVVAVIAASRDQAATVHGYIKGFLQASPLLNDQIESITRDEIMLKGNIRIATMANSFRTSRGATILACIADEVAYWRSEDSATPDVEVFRAVLPSLIASGGLWFAISTGYRRAGLLFERNRDFFGQSNDDILAIAGPTETFNPLISADLIGKARDEDTEAAEAEWGGGWRRDIAAFLDDKDIEAAIDYDRPSELQPRYGLKYKAFADPSGGRHDAFAIAIGHYTGTRENGVFVLDLVRGAQPPFDPQAVVKEHAALLRDYKLYEITGDNYSAEWASSAYKDAGIKYIQSEKTKSALYLEAQTLFARGGIRIPDHKILLRELRLLERRVHRSGRDSVDHPRGLRDDHANAVLACAALTMARSYRISMDWVDGGKTTSVDLAIQDRIRFARYVASGGYFS